MSALRRGLPPLLLAAAVVGLAVMRHDAGEPEVRATAAEAARAAAIARGITYLTSQRAAVEPHSLFAPAYLGRRYGFPELSRFAEAFDASSPAFARQPVLNRMMAHAYDREQRVETLELEGQHALAALIFPAVHCDYLPLPADYETRVAAAIRAGGYDTTHAALVLGLTRERGCALPRHAALRTQAIEALATALRRARAATDVNMETCAMLGYLGAPRRIEQRWLPLVRRAQRPDGGWGYPNAERSDWHHTTMALLCMLALQRPDAPPAAMLPTSSALP